MAVLRLKEYERIAVGKAFDPALRTVTPSQQQQLERLSERYRVTRGARVFANGPRGALIAQQFVGVIDLGAHQIEILPKIDAPDGSIRTRLVRMIAEAWRLDIRAQGSTLTAQTNDTVLEIMIRLYCGQLWSAVRQGLVRRYQPRREDLPVLRGRIDVSHQIRRNLCRPDRLHCRFDEFTADNPLNRALKAALRALARVARGERSARSVGELLLCFDEVADQDRVDWRGVHIDRLSRRYAPLLEMARVFIDGASPDVLAGNGDGYALLFDMNELFERYVGRQAVRALRPLGFDVTLQKPKRMLALDRDGAGAFELRPDIVVSDAQGPVAILDTKWKRLLPSQPRDGVASADAYQMGAYSSRYGVERVVLLYPHHDGLGSWVVRRAAYALLEPHGPPARHVLVSTVDLNDLDAIGGRLAATISCGTPD